MIRFTLNKRNKATLIFFLIFLFIGLIFAIIYLPTSKTSTTFSKPITDEYRNIKSMPTPEPTRSDVEDIMAYYNSLPTPRPNNRDPNNKIYYEDNNKKTELLSANIEHVYINENKIYFNDKAKKLWYVTLSEKNGTIQVQDKKTYGDVNSRFIIFPDGSYFRVSLNLNNIEQSRFCYENNIGSCHFKTYFFGNNIANTKQEIAIENVVYPFEFFTMPHDPDTHDSIEKNEDYFITNESLGGGVKTLYFKIDNNKFKNINTKKDTKIRLIRDLGKKEYLASIDSNIVARDIEKETGYPLVYYYRESLGTYNLETGIYRLLWDLSQYKIYENWSATIFTTDSDYIAITNNGTLIVKKINNNEIIINTEIPFKDSSTSIPGKLMGVENINDKLLITNYNDFHNTKNNKICYSVPEKKIIDLSACSVSKKPIGEFNGKKIYIEKIELAN